MRLATKLKLWGALALLVGLAVAGLYGWWALELRWRPHTIERDQPEIARMLQSAGWVSPGGGAKKLYVLAYGGCAACDRVRKDLLPKLAKAGVETRVIAIARGELNGAARSTPAERSTVAELWVNRSWPLLERWLGAPAGTWTAAGIPAADGDAARTAVVEQGRRLADDLARLTAHSGFPGGELRYPTLIWWDQEGRMRGCVCDDPQTYRFVRKELGAT